MKNQSAIRCLAHLTCTLILASAGFAQGPLTPSGAPAATMKSLDQIEPRTVITSLPWTVSAPGGYVVDRNLSLGSGNGISVTVSDVTLELNGFVLAGDPAGGGHGIHVAAGAENVTIKNGVLRNWGADGVHAWDSGRVTVRDLHIYGSGGNGVAMNKGELIDAMAKNSGLAGARSQDDGVIRNFKALGNSGGGIVLEGVCGMMRPGCCQLSPSEKLALLPKLLKSCGFRGTCRMLAWFGTWTKHDLKEPHWHLGPVGVERELQGQGIGSVLLREFCGRMDTERATAWLETDKDINVPFYRKFGFDIVAETPVIGVPNWFMRRPAGDLPPRPA